MKTYDTEARRALCEFMKNNAERQFTAEELCAAVSHSAGKSTVYRLIARLCYEERSDVSRAAASAVRTTRR